MNFNLNSLGCKTLVSGGQDLTLKLWDLAKLKKDKVALITSTATEIAHEKDINSVVMAPNDKFIATGSQDKSVKVCTLLKKILAPFGFVFKNG